MTLTSRLAVMAVLTTLACAGQPDGDALDGDAPEELRSDPRAFGDPLAGLTPEQRARFEAGKDAFLEVDTIDQGLGPVFNEAACAACHLSPAVGGGSARLETRFGRVEGGRFDPLASLGGSLLQDHGIGLVGTTTFLAEVIPAEANVVAKRRTTPLFGLGLVDAVPDEELQHLARLERAIDPSTAGVVSMVPDLSKGRLAVGKFGWKAQNPTLFQFSGDAYVNEMGITNPQFPDEQCPQGDCALLAGNPVPGLNNDGADVVAFTDFMTFLAPPPRAQVGAAAIAGEVLFVAVGCASCHTPALVTGKSPVAALSHKIFHPFSDFLLHDMGSLGDGIVQGPANGRQLRTAPLWGVRAVSPLLHDGRAPTLEAAIRAHDGQGAKARNRFAALRSGERAALLAFLGTL
jgi:CxxC motif-containing protein (DUF1111 family)